MGKCSRRTFLKQSAIGVLGTMGSAHLAHAQPSANTAKRPNILFAIADDWSWPHASAYDAPGVHTPNFDRIAREGWLFHQAFTAAPQCSPNRAATLTGRHIWQIEEAGTHGSIFPKTYPVFTDLLEASGYHIGFTGKAWGPGDWQAGGWNRNPAGPEYNTRQRRRPPASAIDPTDHAANFGAFLEARPEGAPFFFWFGSKEPHRGYDKGSGLRAGKDPAGITVPPFLPDVPEVRNDLLDYLVEVEDFDAQLGAILSRIEAAGELDNTIIVVTSDNGMPFPRAKANLYEYGTRVPLAIRWGASGIAGKQSDALIGFIDFAPAFLEAAGLQIPDTMTGHSFLGLIRNGDAVPQRTEVQTGRERHTHARFDNLGYPSRALRTQDYLYIHNFKPDRWPAGDPDEYHDIDASPTKSFMLEHRQEFPRHFDLAVGRRPAEELFDIRKDPACMENLAGSTEYAPVRDELRERLMTLLRDQGDPRVLGTGDIFESYPRMGAMRPELGGFAQRGQYNPKYRPASDPAP